ncbi:MAG: hypothetical protein CL849_04935 [Crocinitomicaceae bacterium]|nr:hypothetical protein [Crocinitomicaceae bacterium]
MTGHPHHFRPANWAERPLRFAVVGGGVMGGFTAASLIQAGVQVTLYDPNAMGTGPGASVDTGRSFRVHYGNDQHLISMAVRARRLWSEWSIRMGWPLLHETGKLLVEQQGDRHALESWRAMRDMGLRADRLSEGRVAEEWPGFRADQVTVDRLGGVLDPGVILAGLASWLSNEGIEWKKEAFEVKSNAVRCGGGWSEYDQVVLTSGAWTQRWIDVPMEVTRQELVYFDASALGERLNRLPVFSDLASGFYAIPTVKDGRIKVANHHPGRAGHPDGDERKVSSEFKAQAREFLSTHLPELAESKIELDYVCFYSGTADRDFILDRTPDGLIVGAGFSGHGFKFGPLIGRLLAQMALGIQPEVDLNRFSMTRETLIGEATKIAV